MQLQKEKLSLKNPYTVDPRDPRIDSVSDLAIDGMEWIDQMDMRRKYFKKDADRRATKEEAYKWSTEDM